jgi:hypothetical protein
MIPALIYEAMASHMELYLLTIAMTVTLQMVMDVALTVLLKPITNEMVAQLSQMTPALIFEEMESHLAL